MIIVEDAGFEPRTICLRIYLHVLEALQKDVEEEGQDGHEVDEVHHTARAQQQQLYSFLI